MIRYNKMKLTVVEQRIDLKKNYLNYKNTYVNLFRE